MRQNDQAMIEYEYRVLTFGRGMSRDDARRVLTEQAEYEQWELARSREYIGGWRRVWLRRRVIRVRRSEGA